MEDTAHFSAKEAEADGSTVADSLVGWLVTVLVKGRKDSRRVLSRVAVVWSACYKDFCMCVYGVQIFCIRRFKSRRLPEPRSWRLWLAVSAEIGWPATDLDGFGRI
jgi:hypothetical protein